MNDTASTSTDVFLEKLSGHDLSSLNDQTLVGWMEVMLYLRLVFESLEVEVGRKNHAHNLFTSPSRCRLENGRLGDHTIPLRNPQHDVHDLLFGQEDVAACHFVDTAESVLDNTHQRGVLLWGDDVSRYHTELLQLRPSLLTLRNVQVHLVTVEIGVVGSSDGEVKTEGRVRHDSHSVTHHGLFVQRGLTIEENYVTINDVTLDFPTILQVDVAGLLCMTQIYAVARATDDISGTGPLCWTIGDASLQTLDVEVSDGFWEGQSPGDAAWDTDLVQGQVGITGDDSTGGEVHTLAHQVLPQSTLLTLQTGAYGLDGTTTLMLSSI